MSVPSDKTAALPLATPVPRDLVVRVGRLAGFAIYFVGDRAYYKQRPGVPSLVPGVPVAAGQELEVEFSLPLVTHRILLRAPKLVLLQDGTQYLCALKPAQQPARGNSLVEAVFRAFADAKANTRAVA